MYLNFNTLYKSGLMEELGNLMFLIALKQKDLEATDLYYNGDVVEEWLEKGWIKRLKKGELRIDSKGELLLKELSSSDGGVSESTTKIVEWLIKVYKSKPNGIVKNKKETLRRCQWWVDQTGIDENKLALLLKSFMADSYDPSLGTSIEEQRKVNPRLVISLMTDNIFWTPPNNFARHYTLDDSPLWRYYEDNIDWINQIWEKYDK